MHVQIPGSNPAATILVEQCIVAAARPRTVSSVSHVDLAAVLELSQHCVIVDFSRHHHPDVEEMFDTPVQPAEVDEMVH